MSEGMVRKFNDFKRQRMITKKEFRRNWILDPSKEMVVESEIDIAYDKYKLNLLTIPVVSVSCANADSFKLIETADENCCNCKGNGDVCDGGGAWVYCETRNDNDEQFNGDCGETLGCNLFVRRNGNER
jgi:hypothetical protein